ncbi:MAG TPA: hypothetical protein VIN10_14070 [Bacteroidales bacterium]
MKSKTPDFYAKNPNNYKWSMFYFNPRDERTIVPKMNPALGWTLNFARPSSYFLLIGIIAIIPLTVFLIEYFGNN